MTRNKSNVIAGLLRKGFENNKNTHHQYYTYRTIDGKLSEIYTYTSHSGKELNDSLLSKMSRQCKLKREEFLKLVDCTMTQEVYEQNLKNQKII